MAPAASRGPAGVRPPDALDAGASVSASYVYCHAGTCPPETAPDADTIVTAFQNRGPLTVASTATACGLIALGFTARIERDLDQPGRTLYGFTVTAAPAAFALARGALTVDPAAVAAARARLCGAGS